MHISRSDRCFCLSCMTIIGLSVLKHILTPRMKASHIAIESMKDHLDAVYDITVAYEGTLTADGKRRSAPSMPGTVTHFTPFSYSQKNDFSAVACSIAQKMDMIQLD